MSPFVRSRFVLLVLVAVSMFPARGPAAPEEDASAVMEKVWARYAVREDFELRVAMRSLSFFSTGHPGAGVVQNGGLHVRRENHEVLRLTWREPNDCLMLYQMGVAIGPRVAGTRTLALSRVGDQGGRLLTWNPKSKGTTQEDFEGDRLFNEAQGKLGRLMTDPVVAQVIGRRGGPGYYRASDRDLRVVGEENWSGVRILRIDGGGQGGTRSSLWVDPERALLVRTRSGDAMGGSREVVETVYEYDFNKQITAGDLDAFANVRKEAEAGVIERSSSFGPVGELAAWLNESARTLAEGKPPGSAAPPAAESAPAASPAKTEPVRETQELTPEQMAAIVLIEGESGVGTGFVTRIRELPFVVTNQHVIGGSERLRVNTLAGVGVKVGAIHAAIGRDIAILRIEGEAPPASLKLAEDPLRTAKIGDKVVVVGNRRGGGVATQVSGVVQGLGPDRVEVDAPFQPGNSGSPILHLASGEVIGLATYSQTRRLDYLDASAGGTSGTGAAGKKPEVEQRWFGYRTDGVTKWEAIDLATWRTQAKRVAEFKEDSEAIYHAMNGRFKEASGNPRVRLLMDRLEERAMRSGASQALLAQEVNEFFRGLRALTESGTKELKTGVYYDFFRTSLYWETSIPEQLRAREELAKGLDKASENVNAFLAKLRR